MCLLSAFVLCTQALSHPNSPVSFCIRCKNASQVTGSIPPVVHQRLKTLAFWSPSGHPHAECALLTLLVGFYKFVLQKAQHRQLQNLVHLFITLSTLHKLPGMAYSKPDEQASHYEMTVKFPGFTGSWRLLSGSWLLWRVSAAGRQEGDFYETCCSSHLPSLILTWNEIKGMKLVISSLF